MNRSRLLPLLSLTGLLLSACAGTGTPTPAPGTPGTATPYGRLTTLNPGAKGAIEQSLRVNIVSIGFRAPAPGQVAGPRELNREALEAELPEKYTTKNRYPSFYLNQEPTGNNFTFDYNHVTASQAIEDEFFAYLLANGTERSVKGANGELFLNIAAANYNCQENGALPGTSIVRANATPSPVYHCPTPAGNIAQEIKGNLEIDGALVEKWLGDNLSRMGIDATEHTVVLINWYGRPDFKFHSYSHLRPDGLETDTNVNFAARSTRRTIAWGGTTSADQNNAKRLWFIDPSANPDYWTSSWDMTNSDVDGDKIYDKRLPPIWEYGTRKASVAYAEKISGDMGKVIRYVGINLLFTPSPLYRVELTPPEMPENLNLDIAIEQGAGAVDAASVIKPDLAQQRVSVLQPFAKWSHSVRTSPLSGDLAKAYQCLFPATDDTCSPNFADPDGELFFQQALADIRQRAQATPGTYNVPTYLFNDGDQNAVNTGLLGRANNDGVTGTQTFTANFLTPALKSAGYGFTDTVVHETGHHLSQSHPHDGYDSERDEDYGPSGDTLFVDVGDEVHSVMSYNNLTKEFGQFNRDAQYRYLTTAYMSNANAILELAVGAGKVNDTRAAVVGADQKFAQAKAAYAARKYLAAAQLAHDGYRAVADAAKAAGVSVQAYKWYDRVDQLSASRVAPKAVNHMRPIQGQGPVVRPEETPYQRSKRLAP